MEHDPDQGQHTDPEQAEFEAMWDSDSGHALHQWSRVSPRPFETGDPVERVDLGPGGSLRQRARVARVPLGWRHAAAGGLFTVAVVGLVLCVVWLASGDVGAGLLALLAAGVAAAAAAWCAWQVRNPAAWLAQQAARERAVARALRPLQAAGWVVLYDRLLPGSEHRVANLVLGPTGLTVVTPLPRTGRIEIDLPVDRESGAGDLRAGMLVIDAQPESEWQLTREAECLEITTIVPDLLDDVVWTSHCWPTYLALDTIRTGLLGLRREPALLHPAACGDGMVCPPAALTHALGQQFPNTLGPEQVHRVATALDQAFRPAGRRSEPSTRSPA